MLTRHEALVLQARGMRFEVARVFDVSKGAYVLLARKALQGLAQWCGKLRGNIIGLELPNLMGSRNYLARNQGHMVEVARRLSHIMLAAGTLPLPASVESVFNDAYLSRNAS